MITMKVDVIIPTFKPDEKFRRLLFMLSKQSISFSQIIIMNTEEAWWNPGFCEGIDRIQVYHVPKKDFDHGGTRNLAAHRSDADIMVFMTQDAVPADEYLLERLVEPFADEQVAAAYARQLPDEHCGEIEKYTRQFNYPEEDRKKTLADLDELGIKTFFCSNVCAAYRRSTYFQLGGFVKKTIFNEDMIYAGTLIREGYAVSYASKALVIHSHNYGCLTQFKRNFDLAVSQQQHPEVFSGVRSESEGIRLVKQTAGHLRRIHKPWLIVKLIVQSGFKFMGYRFGRNYEKLPKGVVKLFTMNKAYWNG
ncbi:glycosyltransferase [Diplocloster agilis]|uniref:Glycosyltransferase n=1 Tax=Diplocloster agilis TaxID=2850323 RepID=A0A949JYS0_9FIRM|nr:MULTISPECIES: glycosyltransferase [Lachnospiraceae]MBU9736554.1 glycosyltransferase [Diplocloster agilis]MCU6735158.1 glycosyltransferase [Suonthocola fibrivorans]SCJ65976.1 mycofactocin system glycosyltransferase [uncultured Clostridium sp.]